MTLLERFIEIKARGPTLQGTVLFGLLLPVHVLLVIAVYWIDRAGLTAGFDTKLVLAYLTAWAFLVAAFFATGLGFVLRGRDQEVSQVVNDLITAFYAAFVVGVVYLFGSASTAYAAIIPVMALITAVAYEFRQACTAVITMLGLLLVVGVLESSGVLPYAPALLDRSLDAERNDIFFAFSYGIGIFVPLVVSLGTIGLVLAGLERATGLIRRYVPSQIADAIMAGRDSEVNAHARRKLTIFFSDLVGFTDITEQLDPEDLSRVLNEYFSEMTAIAKRHDGTVDELSGDAILIFFGAPQVTDDRDHALRAVRMAIEMQAAIAALNAKWKAAGIDVVFRARMAINTGVATIGNFGSEGRTKYAALGRAVNLAARLQSQAEATRILVSHPTWLLVQDQIPCTPKGELQLKGIAKPVKAYEVS